MSIFAKFDQNGTPIGYWIREAFSGTIPEDAVEITSAQHDELLSNQGRRRFIDGTVVVYDPPVTAASLTDYAADVRWRKEVGGIVVGGVPIATDDRSKQMILGARVAADADPNWTTQWVGSDGAVYPVSAAAIVAISDAVQAHVNACFATYASVKEAIDAGTINVPAQIEIAFEG